jgi:carboxypeptidase Taq
MSNNNKQKYDELIKRSKEVNVIGTCAGVLGWDEQTNMPRAGAAHRAEQSAFLRGLGHEKFTDPKLGELLTELEKTSLMDDEFSDEAVNIRELRHDYDLAVKIPKELVEELSRTRILAQAAWVEARSKSEFSIFQPLLEKVIELKKKEADCLGYEKEPYDALLDEYEPGMSAEAVKNVFDSFKDELIELVGKIADAPKKPDISILERHYDVERQKVFSQAAAAAIGYDFSIGRLDVTAHPFTTGLGPNDVRITTRYNPNHLGQALFGTLHEAGHGIYNQNLDSAHYGTPRGSSVSLGIHESQSRMWENHVGRGRAFWKHFFPRAKQVFPDVLADVAFDDFFFAINDVRPSFIRVESDEVTYNLHILIRFEIELAFLRGDLAVKDIPSVWNEKIKQYLGITPANDAEGCLQDIHWSMGAIGYFPTYTLGNLYSAQFYAKATEEIDGLEDQFAVGNFTNLKNWLTEKIHMHGCRYRAEKLVEVVTGKPLSHEYSMNYLKNKFGELYGI